MKWTDQFVAQLSDEAPRTRRTLDRFPSGHDDWKPHGKSMTFGNLARLVATMPTWFPMIINMDELDIGGGAGGSYRQVPLRTAAELVVAHDKAVADARAALSTTSDDHLMKPWRLLVSGKVVSEQPRNVVHALVSSSWAVDGLSAAGGRSRRCDLRAVGRRHNLRLIAGEHLVKGGLITSSPASVGLCVCHFGPLPIGSAA